VNTGTPIAKVCLGAAFIFVTVPLRAAVEVNDKTDISLTEFVPCAAGGAGEVVDLSGPLHTLLTFTINGNQVSALSHFQPQGITGIGETTGERYHATGITKESFTASLQNGQANSTFVNNFRMIGQGPGNNLLIHETAHMTINADGTATVTHDNLSIDCR
jgi:hypothetical protein